MIGQLTQFSIYDLWGEKQVHLKFGVIINLSWLGKMEVEKQLY